MEVSVRGDRLVGRDNRTGGRIAGQHARWAVREFILQFLASSLTEGSIYGLMALGLVITLRSTEVLFFGQGTMAMVGGVMMYALFAQAHMPLIISIPCTLMICIIISLLSLRVIVLPLLARGAPSLNVSMVTIGVSMIFEMLAMIIFGKDPLAVPSFSGDNPVTVFGASFVPQHFWILGFTAFFLLVTLVFFKGTWMGKAMTGLGDNPLLAKASGFPVSRLFMYSFVFAALVGGIAGIVSAPTSYTGYSVGLPITLKGFIAASVGGITNPLGALLGGLIIGFFESFTAGFVSSRLKDLITFVLLLLVLRLRPQGLLGSGS
jgi:branched-chain amino acid transport system permease protein